jgi:hypothetical protein
LDDKFYRERARHVRELVDKADPFIRKRLLDLAGNYDSLVSRSLAQRPLCLPMCRTSSQRIVGRRTRSRTVAAKGALFVILAKVGNRALPEPTRLAEAPAESERPFPRPGHPN